MFEQYLISSKTLLDDAHAIQSNIDESKTKMLYRSAIWHLSGAIEAFLNTAVIGLNRTTIDPLLIAFLQDKNYKVNIKTGAIAFKTEYHSVEDRLNLLAVIYNCELPKQGKIWNDFLALKTLRDELMHPKQEEDLISLSRYYTVGSNGLTAVLQILGLLNKKIYGKVFRKNLRELND